MWQRLAITPGEPAGVGPDLLLYVASYYPDIEMVAFADPELLAGRAQQLKLPVQICEWHPETPRSRGALPVCPSPLPRLPEPGNPRPENAEALLHALDQAIAAVTVGHCSALVTGPLHKEVMAVGCQRPFSGHTEYLATALDTPTPVMMLVGRGLRVSLVTTHIPLHAVAGAVTSSRVEHTVHTTVSTLQQDFGIPHPRLLVTGLNPHAGEGGHIGEEEQTTIRPALDQARSCIAGEAEVEGPVSADTAFVPSRIAHCDAVVCMYHDQGLIPIKQWAFGHAVNVTLGLPVIRTSVDHGTALELAGTGRAEAGSLVAAIGLARELAANRYTNYESQPTPT